MSLDVLSTCGNRGKATDRITRLEAPFSAERARFGLDGNAIGRNAWAASGLDALR
jgi:hypothetical protein